ncbi:MAG: HupU protein, partial [Marivivens sp.]|nr:HupU protein [Marivivens sp.]
MNVLWLQASGCGGCTMSLLCAENPNVFDLLGGAGINFIWHPALSVASGDEVRRLLAQI